MFVGLPFASFLISCNCIHDKLSSSFVLEIRQSSKDLNMVRFEIIYWRSTGTQEED